VEYRPDAVIIIGDWWDCPSLNNHSEKGSAELENSRYQEDVEAGNEAFRRLVAPMDAEIARFRKFHRRDGSRARCSCVAITRIAQTGWRATNPSGLG